MSLYLGLFEVAIFVREFVVLLPLFWIEGKGKPFPLVGRGNFCTNCGKALYYIILYCTFELLLSMSPHVGWESRDCSWLVLP